MAPTGNQFMGVCNLAAWLDLFLVQALSLAVLARVVQAIALVTVSRAVFCINLYYVAMPGVWQ